MRVSSRLEIFKGPGGVAFACILWFLVATATMIAPEWYRKWGLLVLVIFLTRLLRKHFPKWISNISDLEEERVFLEKILADEKLRKDVCK